MKSYTILFLSLIFSIFSGIGTESAHAAVTLYQPSGSYSVGKIIRNIPDQTSARELEVHFWYPAEKNSYATYTKYRPEFLSELKQNLSEGLQQGILEGLFPIEEKDQREKTIQDLDIDSWEVNNTAISRAQTNYPVIIFSHGYGCNPAMYSAYCQTLASSGYVVAAMDHTKAVGLNREPDGSIANITLKTLSLWQADVAHLLDYLESINGNDNEVLFKDKLAIDCIGMMGHSAGGMLTTQMGGADERIKACISLDSQLTMLDFEKVFTKPCCFLLAEDFYKNIDKKIWVESFWNNEIKKEKLATKHLELCTASTADAFILELKSASHMTFSDFVLLQDILRKTFNDATIDFGHTGTINGTIATNIVCGYITSFFDHYLLGKKSDVLAADNQYQEISIQRFITSKST